MNCNCSCKNNNETKNKSKCECINNLYNVPKKVRTWVKLHRLSQELDTAILNRDLMNSQRLLFTMLGCFGITFDPKTLQLKKEFRHKYYYGTKNKTPNE